MLFFLMHRQHSIFTRTDTLFPYTTLFRSRLAADMVVDPRQFFLQPFGWQSRGAEHAHTARLRYGDDNVAAVREGEEGKFDAEHGADGRSEEHTSELQSLMRISYAVFCLKKKKQKSRTTQETAYEKHKRNDNHI